MREYRIVAESEKDFTIEDGEGRFRVAKNGLSKANEKKIRTFAQGAKKMADGGEALPEEMFAPQQSQSVPSASVPVGDDLLNVPQSSGPTQVPASSYPEANQTSPANPTQVQGDGSTSNNFRAWYMEGNPGAPQSESKPSEPTGPGVLERVRNWAKQGNEDTPLPDSAYSQEQGQSVPGKAQPSEAEPQFKISDSDVSAAVSGRPAQSAGGASGASSGVPSRSAPPQPVPSWIKEGEDGLVLANEAQRALDAEKAKATQSRLDAVNKADATFNANMEKHRQDLQRIRQEVMSESVDPDRWYSNRSTGQKISGAIALFLGGLGGALTGKGNIAQEIFEKAIDRDLEAQRLDLGKKQTLIGQLMQEGRDYQEAYKVARAQMMENAAAQAEVQLAKFGDAKTAADLKLKLADFHKGSEGSLLDMETKRKQNVLTGVQTQAAQEELVHKRTMNKIEAVRAAAMARMMNGAGGNPNQPLTIEEDRERGVNIPNVGRVYAHNKESQGKLYESTSAFSEANDGIGFALKERDAHGASVKGSDWSKRAERIKARLTFATAKLFDTKPSQLGETEKHLIDILSSDPGQVRGDDFKNAMDELQQLAREKYSRDFFQYTGQQLGGGGGRAMRPIATVNRTRG